MGEYTLSVAPERGLLHMTLSGFFSLDEVAMLDTDRTAALKQLGCLPNQHVTICDIRDMQISKQEVVAAFTAVVGHPRYASRKLAMISKSSLARSQARRVTSRSDVAYFDNIAEAEAWLFSDPTP